MRCLYVIILIPFLLLSQGCATTNTTIKKSHIIDSRQKLKDYGMAFCMRYKTPDEKSQTYKEFSIAEGAYFYSGSHDLRIYKNVRKFVEENYQESAFSTYDKDVALVSCLSLYNSPEYNDYIKQLDSEIYE